MTHIRTAQKCRTRNRWLRKKNEATSTNANNSYTANVANTQVAQSNSASNLEENTSVPTQDVQSLLATKLNIVVDNDELRDKITAALTTTTNM